MLKSDKGNIMITGSLRDISAELANLLNKIHFEVLQNNLKMSENEARDVMMEIVETALLPIEEVHRRNMERMEQDESLSAKVIEMLKAMQIRR